MAQRIRNDADSGGVCYPLYPADFFGSEVVSQERHRERQAVHGDAQRANGSPKINLALALRDQDAVTIETMNWFNDMKESIRKRLGQSKRKELAKPNESRKLIQEYKEVAELLKQHNDTTRRLQGNG